MTRLAPALRGSARAQDSLEPVEELRGLVYSETPKDERTDPNEAGYPWYRRTLPLAGVALAMVIVLNVIF